MAIEINVRIAIEIILRIVSMLHAHVENGRHIVHMHIQFIADLAVLFGVHL